MISKPKKSSIPERKVIQEEEAEIAEEKKHEAEQERAWAEWSFREGDRVDHYDGTR